MRLLPLLALLCGCEEAIVPTTVIEHLQIVSMVADPPVVAPHQSTQLTVTIADPDALSPEVAVWVCVPFGAMGRCLESELTGQAQPVFTGTRDPTTHAFFTTVVPLGVDVDEINEVLDSDQTFAGVLAFALACAPGACELFDQVEAEAVDPIDLSDPSRLLRGVPMSQAHAAWRTLPVSSGAGRGNPLLYVQFPSPLEVGAGGSVDITARSEPALVGSTIHPMATVGGFPEDSLSGASAAGATAQWLTREQDAGTDGHIYLVVDDGLGGQAVAHHPASVR